MELGVASCLEALKERVDMALGDILSRWTCQCQLDLFVLGLSTILEIFFQYKQFHTTMMGTQFQPKEYFATSFHKVIHSNLTLVLNLMQLLFPVFSSTSLLTSALGQESWLWWGQW